MRLALSSALLLCVSAPAWPDSGAVPPHRMLWAWYPGSDLEPVLPPDTGVAFIVASLYLSGSEPPVPNVRRAGVRVGRDTCRMGVIRIEHNHAAFTGRQRELTAGLIADAVRVTRVPAIQIDFDAPKSAWPFYRALLKDVRQRIGPRVFLSMTALASWCGQDSWLAGVDVDEIVPMLFHFGRESAAMVDRVRSGAPLPFQGCRESVGVATPGERISARGRRVYLFPNHFQWTQESVTRALEAYQP